MKANNKTVWEQINFNFVSQYPSKEFSDDPKPPEFDGHHYAPKIDRDRLTGQMKDIFSVIGAGGWWTVAEISRETGHPQASISAQLRNLRKERFGALNIQGRYRKNTRIFEYNFKDRETEK